MFASACHGGHGRAAGGISGPSWSAQDRPPVPRSGNEVDDRRPVTAQNRTTGAQSRPSLPFAGRRDAIGQTGPVDRPSTLVARGLDFWRRHSLGTPTSPLGTILLSIYIASVLPIVLLFKGATVRELVPFWICCGVISFVVVRLMQRH